MLSLSKLSDDGRTVSNGFPGFTNSSNDLNQLASLYAGNSFGNGLLSAAYGFSSLFSRFYPQNSFLGSTNSQSAANSTEESMSGLANLGTMPTWPSQPFLPPPQGLSPSLSSNSATPPTSTSGSISNPMMNSFSPSTASLPFIHTFGIHPFDFSRFPSPANNESFNLKNFDPRAMLSAYFGAFGNSTPMEPGTSLPNSMLHQFGSNSSHSSVSQASLLNSANTVVSTTHSAPTTSSSSSNSSVSSSSKLNSPVANNTHESKYSPLSLSSLNEQLEQNRDLLQLHETLNQRFKATTNLSSITSNSAFGNRFFPYNIRPFLYNGQQQPSAKFSSINESDDKLLSPKSDSDDLCDKKLRRNSETSSECGSPTRSNSSGHQSRADSECTSPRSNESQPLSPVNFDEKNEKQPKQIKTLSKESIQELKNMQRMVEGLDTTAPTITAT